MPSTLVGVALLLAATALLATPRPRLAPRLAGARAELPPGFYASTEAPAAGGGATTPGSAAARTGVEAALDEVSRRKLLRWFGWATLLVILGELVAGFLPFFWPKKTGTFGGNVLAGSVGDYKVGDVKKIVEGKFFISRVPEGFLALWQKCPHLGCTVPWLDNAPSLDSIEPNGRFNCPCHGSLYDRYGQIKGGPAPRPMDMFPISIRDGRIFVETGPSKAIQRSVSEGDEHSRFPVPA
jgi:cytochrome b6-f complex iron-sulfur subunit